MSSSRAHARDDPDRERRPPKKLEGEPPVAAPREHATLSPDQVVALQQGAGNRALGRLLQRLPDAPVATPGKTAAPDPTAASEPFELGPATISTYSDATFALLKWCMDLDAEAKGLQQEGRAVPAELESARAAGMSFAELLRGGEAEPLDRGNAEDLRKWYAKYVKALNAARAEQAFEAARRARAAADRLRELQAELAKLEPALRDAQRARFRDGDEGGLLQIADAIATVLDSGLAAKGAIEQILDVADDLATWGGRGSAGQIPMDVTGKVRGVMNALEKINKVWASVQLARAAIDLMFGGKGKTDLSKSHTAISAMATGVSAGGTLLGASAGFSLYANLYIGPMTEACLSALSKLENLISTGSNRDMISAGRPDLVNWTVEPGGRPMYTFMIGLMHAGSLAAVATPSGDAREYFVDNADDFSAGVGSAGELPTEGHWFWKDTDDDKFPSWAYQNRKHIWGMLYGSAEPAKDAAF